MRKKYRTPQVTEVELNPQQAVLASCKAGTNNNKSNDPTGFCSNACKNETSVTRTTNYAASS
ncbi:MAG: hypothetical protein HY652_05915 [Acidobacteria bacterium]|nr:hypothetical protein [Acidobacteriota bacterium]